MSRRHKDRPAGAQASAPIAAHMQPISVQQAASAPLAPAAEQVLEKALNAGALESSVVTQPPADPARTWGETLTLLLAHEADDIPPWGTAWAIRDEKLMELWPTEPTIAGALATLAMRNACMELHFEGPSRTVDAVQQMWHEADNGQGAASWFTKLSIALYAQDNGAFPEWIRADYVSAEDALKRIASGKPLPPVVGLGVLDARWCTRTGNPLYPVIYEDPDDPQRTKHMLPWHVVSPMAELPSPVKLARGRQYCALTRVLHAAQYMRDVNIFRREKVTGRNAAEIQVIGGPSKSSIEDAVAQMEERAANRGYLRYMPPVIVASMDPTKPISSATLGWASLPDGFDYDAELRNYITVLAMCLGEDYLTFAPLPGGNQGTAAQSAVLTLKTRGKGPALWQKLVTHMLNFNGVLPRTVKASFEERDIEAEAREAEVAQTWIKVIADMIASGTMTPKVGQQWLADNQIVLDDDYLAMLGEEDATDSVTLSDDDLQDETTPEAIDAQPPAGPPPAPQQSGAPQQAPQQAARGGGKRFFRKALALVWLTGRRATLRYYKAAGDIEQIVNDFAATIEDALTGYMDGTYGRARGQRIFEAAIKEAWLPAAERGYEDGGSDVADLEASDYADIRDAENAQIGYARDFWAALPDIRKDDGDPLGRGELYVSSLRAHYAVWKGLGAGNPMLTWELGETETHCADGEYNCTGLAGTAHTLKWYVARGLQPRMPGSKTQCGGFRCQCRWINAKTGEEFTL